MSIKSEFVTPDHHRTNGFGRQYIQTQLKMASHEISLAELREELRDVEEYLEDGFSRSIQISPWLKKSLGDVAFGGVVSTLTHKQNDEYVVNELLFENAIQANNYALAQMTLEKRPEFDAFVDEFRARTIDLIEAGVLPDDLNAKLNNLIGIGFAISEGYAAQDALAECEHGRGDKPVDIIISPKAMDGSVSYKATVFHELVHAVAGPKTGDYLREYLKPLLPNRRATSDVAYPLEEALTEHITQVILGSRDIEDVNIEENAEAYVTERGFLSAVGSKVSMNELVNVYFGATPNQLTATKLKSILCSEDEMALSDYFQLSDYDAIDAAFAVVKAKHDPLEDSIV